MYCNNIIMNVNWQVNHVYEGKGYSADRLLVNNFKIVIIYFTTIISATTNSLLLIIQAEKLQVRLQNYQ